jgi:hypothetical protein
MEAYVRLIAALDKNIPCWPETNHKLPRTYNPVGQFDLTLARVVREAGGQITVAEAYRRFSHPGGRHYRWLTVEKFLQMLRSTDYTAIEFTDPQSPIIRLRAWNGESFRARIRSDQPSAPSRTDPATIPFFGSNSILGKYGAIGPR